MTPYLVCLRGRLFDSFLRSIEAVSSPCAIVSVVGHRALQDMAVLIWPSQTRMPHALGERDEIVGLVRVA
ncbi:hypothetical protein [Bradyrhizobium cenepequi]